MIALYKYIGKVNNREGKELSKLKDNIGQTIGHEAAMNNFRLEIKRFLTNKGVEFQDSLPG